MGLLILVGSSLRAQSDPLGFSIGGASVTEKDTFTVALSADSLLTGRSVLAYRFYITYSPTYFEFLGMDGTGPVLSGWSAPVINSSNDGTIILAGAGATELTGSGEMVYLQFRSKRSGNSWLSFNTSESYLNEGNPSSVFVNGLVSSAALSYPNIYPDNQDLYIGDEVTMNVSGGQAPYVYTTSDPAVLQVTDGSTVRAVGPGTTRVTVTDDNGETSVTSGLFDVRAIRMDMEEVAVWPNDTFYIPVKLEIAPGTSVWSGRFDLEFNNSLKALPDDIIQGDFPVYIESHPKNGVVSVSFASNAAISGNGILCYLPFRAGGSGNQYTRFANMRFNETLLAWSVRSSWYMNVRSLPNLNMSPNSGTLMWGELLKINVSNGTAPYQYTVSDSEVASIDIQGNLQAITGGEVQVTATDANGATRTSGTFMINDNSVSLYETEGTLDTETKVPIVTSSLPPGKAIYGYRATFSFDDTYLEFVRAEAPAGNGLAQASVSGTSIDVAGALGEGVNSGVIGFLVFNIKNTLAIDATTTVTFDSFTANENSLYSEWSGGTVRRVEQTSYRPVAIAGLDFSLQEGTQGQLDGTSSFDLDGDPLTYHWSAPDGILLSDSTSPNPEFVAPYVKEDSVFTVSLTVSDGTTDSDPDEIDITVLQVNFPPQANAGPDENYIEGSSVSLDGSSSFDPDGDVLSYSWEALDGIILFNASAVNPSFILPQVEATTDYRFTLVVNDGALSSQKDTVTITAIQVNKKPVAFAGGDFSVDENEEYTLNGSLSYDADNDPLTYQWTAPPEVTLSSDTEAQPTFTAPPVVRDSVLEFTLVVNDGSRDSDPDIVRATVINLDSLSRDAYIDSVTLPQLDSFALDTASALVTMYLPYGTDTRSLAPGFVLSDGAFVSPPAGSIHDFTLPVYYTVTAEDGETSRIWQVEVFSPEHTMQRELSAGWNWISLNVQPSDPSIGSLFSGLTPTELDYIKSTRYSSVWYSSTGWFGNLENFPARGVIRYNKGVTEQLSVTGREINPAVTPIPLLKGWNDLPFLLNENTAIGAALDETLLPAGDIILKGRQGSALFIEGSGWTGEIDSLRVLHGYRMNVVSAGTAIYTVTSGAKKTVAGYGSHSAPGDGTADTYSKRVHTSGMGRAALLESYAFDPAQYPSSATLIAVARSADGQRFISEGDVLIAMSGDKVRGVSVADRIDALGGYLFVLTYYAHSEEEHVTFSIQTADKEKVYATDLSMAMEGDVIYGTAADPVVLHATDLYVGAEEEMTGARVSVYPNPARDRVMVRSGSPVQAVRMYDLAGTLLRQEHMEDGDVDNGAAEISLQGLEPGVYTLEVETAGETVVRKIIKTAR